MFLRRHQEVQHADKPGLCVLALLQVRLLAPISPGYSR